MEFIRNLIELLKCIWGQIMEKIGFRRRIMQTPMEVSSRDEHPEKAFGWAARDESGVLSPFKFSRRTLGEKDVMFKAQNVVAADRWGGGGGGEWMYLPNGEICKIFITYDQAIHTIRFTSQDENGNFELSNQFGEREGYQKVEIDIDTRAEKLKGISGTFGYYQSSLIITSLGFTTDTNKVFGPFGCANGTPFSFLENDQTIVGFHGRCGWWLDAIGVYVQPVPKVISAGPWGCQEPENKWTYEPKGRSISHISITHDDAIYSIQFTSQDANGNLDQSGKYGYTTGPKSAEISIDIVNEKLNGIGGTYDVKNGYVVVTSLSFSTDKKNCFGPFGCARGTAFSLLVSDQSFIGFYGRAGAWLDAIGVYIQTKTVIRVGQWGSREPGNEFDYAPKGMISHMFITHDDVIYSIRFTSQDDEGNVDHSKRFGIMTGCKSDEIDIDIKNEKLNSISGTFGVKSGYVVVTSLLFSTDKNKVFGPFGTARGTAFSFPVNNGVLSGFHGRSGYWLDAIGVYVKTN